MPSIIEPSNKQKVRAYLQERRESREPPPSRERVRELMGWKMAEDEQALAAAIHVTIR